MPEVLPRHHGSLASNISSLHCNCGSALKWRAFRTCGCEGHCANVSTFSQSRSVPPPFFPYEPLLGVQKVVSGAFFVLFFLFASLTI